MPQDNPQLGEVWSTTNTTTGGTMEVVIFALGSERVRLFSKTHQRISLPIQALQRAWQYQRPAPEPAECTICSSDSFLWQRSDTGHQRVCSDHADHNSPVFFQGDDFTTVLPRSICPACSKGQMISNGSHWRCQECHTAGGYFESDSGVVIGDNLSRLVEILSQQDGPIEILIGFAAKAALEQVVGMSSLNHFLGTRLTQINRYGDTAVLVFRLPGNIQVLGGSPDQSNQPTEALQDPPYTLPTFDIPPPPEEDPTEEFLVENFGPSLPPPHPSPNEDWRQLRHDDHPVIARITSVDHFFNPDYRASIAFKTISQPNTNRLPLWQFQSQWVFERGLFEAGALWRDIQSLEVLRYVTSTTSKNLVSITFLNLHNKCVYREGFSNLRPIVYPPTHTTWIHKETRRLYRATDLEHSDELSQSKVTLRALHSDDVREVSVRQLLEQYLDILFECSGAELTRGRQWHALDGGPTATIADVGSVEGALLEYVRYTTQDDTPLILPSPEFQGLYEYRKPTPPAEVGSEFQEREGKDLLKVTEIDTSRETVSFRYQGNTNYTITLSYQDFSKYYERYEVPTLFDHLLEAD